MGNPPGSFNLSRTWHLQLAIFWIATSWVGGGIFLAPLVGGKEPKYQGFLVDVLFGAIVIVALGSLLGEFLGIRDQIGKMWFLLGNQGWEYVELGRVNLGPRHRRYHFHPGCLAAPG